MKKIILRMIPLLSIAFIFKKSAWFKLIGKVTVGTMQD